MTNDSSLIYDPVYVEASKYDRDMKMLEQMNPSIICKIDRDKLQSIALSYGIKTKVTNENFHQIKGELMELIMNRLKELSGRVIGKEREIDIKKVPKEKQRIEKKESVEEIWSRG